MIWLLLLWPLAALAQTPDVAAGAELFRTTCAVAYCHGPGGTAGRAPQLAGHHFPTRGAVFGIVANGRPNTSMPGFANLLKTDQIEAIAAYVMSLKGDEPAPGIQPKVPALPPALRRGRDLFFDATRTGACGACHELGGRGIPIGLDLRTSKTDTLRGLRQSPAAHVFTARVSGEAAFPALVVEETATHVTVYDLSSRLPVRRSLRPSEVTLAPGGSWSHRDAASLYSDDELEAIAGYLKSLR